MIIKFIVLIKENFKPPRLTKSAWHLPSFVSSMDLIFTVITTFEQRKEMDKFTR